jgi:hypothetical protein
MGKKYDRKIFSKYEDAEITIDVYRVLDAFQVTCPATAHAVKKLLCAGIRGHKDNEQDLAEAAESIEEARAMLKQKRRQGGTRPEPQVQPLPHKFAIGDEVMCLVSGTYRQAKNSMHVHIIDSGECGVVDEVQSHCIVVRFKEPPRLVCMESTRLDKLVKRGAANGQ